MGLCSYLLIGFWFSEKANADAGKKAFIVNRIGDFGFLIAMFLIWSVAGHASTFATVLDRGRAPAGSSPAAAMVTAITLFLFLGCDRQVGPDPALHLAAGRDGRPDAGLRPDPRRHHGHRRRLPGGPDSTCCSRWRRVAVHRGGGVGALTALFAATIALAQYDIKKVLAYSTVSQLGYMFMGVGRRRLSPPASSTW